MENKYQPELWRDLYVMLGTSSAALIGLLFVVTSLHLDEIANNPTYRVRARNNIFYLFALLVEATLILIPQPMAFLGTELIAFLLLLLLMHLYFFYRFNFKNWELGKRAGWKPYNSLRFIASDLLGMAGGVCLVKMSSWGFYLITVAYVFFLGSIILNAWTIMLGVGQSEKMAKAT